MIVTVINTLSASVIHNGDGALARQAGAAGTLSRLLLR